MVEAAAFHHVFSKPGKSSDAYFTVLAAANGLAHGRLGLAISRKIARSAVARQRIKRIVRESFRQQQAQLAGLDIVVMGRSGVIAHDHARLFASLERHWLKLSQSCARC